MIEVKNKSDEKIEVDKNGKTLYVGGKRFDSRDKLREIYFNAFDGNHTPKPIDEKYVKYLISQKVVLKDGPTLW